MSSSEWTEPERLRFGDFEIHPGAARRVRHGRPIALEPRAFSLLLLLARSGGRLVEKQEILEAVWNGAFVTDNAVTRSVARLRKALDDSARVPRFIETVYSRGYRFVAPVEVIDAGADADVEPGSGAGSRRLIWIVAGLVAGLLAVALPRLLLGPAEDPRGEASRAHALDPRRIAVLPLENLSGGTEDEYFVNGLTEQIISNLAQVGGLRVLAGTTMGAFKDSPGRVGEIARELEAGTVLEGSARRSGDKLRIHVQLIDGMSEEHLWSGEFDRSVDDLFVIQSEIAVRVAEALELSISADRLDRIRRGPTAEVGSFEQYLKGREAYSRRTRAGNEEAIQFFQMALRLDPGFALAEAGLANAYATRAIKFGFGPEAADEAVRAAERALELNPELPEAYKAVGIVAFSRDRLRESMKWNRKALELNPSYVEAHYNLSSTLLNAGEWDQALLAQLRGTARSIERSALATELLLLGFTEEGMAVARRALADEPLSEYLTAFLAQEEAYLEKFEAARERIGRLHRAQPGWSRSWLVAGEVEFLAGDFAAARRYFQAADASIATESEDAILALAKLDWVEGENRAARRRMSRVEQAVLPRIEAGSELWAHFWTMAAIESMRGNVEAAVSWYEQAVDLGHRRFWPDAADPAFAPLREHPRFQAQIQRMRAEVERMRAVVEAEVRELRENRSLF